MNDTKEKPRLSIIGLGKLGSPMAASFASRGFSVIGVDLNKNYVDAINQAKAPVFEPDLQQYLLENRERISATQDYRKAVLDSDITFIIVPTPSKPEGDFSTEYVVSAARGIGKALREKNTFHLVALTSTVSPGSTQRDVIPVLEKESGKTCGIEFGVCYNPEFIALGSVIRNILEPDFVLIGESDEKSGSALEEFYRNVCLNKPPVKRMSIINAEIAKISLNVYITTKISYANMLAELCEKIPGADADVVTDAIGCDARIGKKYLKGALGFAGPCFPRDARAFMHLAGSFGAHALLPEATDAVNRRQVMRVAQIISSRIPEGGKVSVLGLSYKPDTDVIDESQGVEIARVLSGKNIPVAVYDPVAHGNAKKVLGESVVFAASLEEAVAFGNAIVIATPWKEFGAIDEAFFQKGPTPKTVVDCWRVLDPKRYHDGLILYFPIGAGDNNT